MADESIVIEITDKVDNSIASKIKTIATESRAGQASLNSLQDALNKLDGTKLQSIVNNSTLASSALTKLSKAQGSLAEANARVEAATSKAAVAQAKANVAQSAAAAASDKAALSALRLADAQQKIADKVQAAQAAENAAVAAQKALNDETARGAKIEADYAAMLARNAAEQQKAASATNATAKARAGGNSASPVSTPALDPKPIKDYKDELAKLLGQIDPVIGALDRLDAQEKKLAQYKKIGAIDADTFNQYKAKLDQAREGLGNFDNTMGKATMSAKQLRQATLYLPAQLGDLARQIAAGGSPMTALFQQGSQLTNMFGGLGAAARAVGGFIVGLINPVTVTIAVFAAFTYAVYKAESSLRELNALSAQFAATGRADVDNSFIAQLRKELMLLPGVSKTAATEVIAAFATVRDIGGKNLKSASVLVADLATALGTDAPKAAKLLADSLLDPIKGAQDLDKQLGFLTIADFKAIKSLSDLGKTAEAQALIIDRLSGAYKGLAEQSLTPLQKATNDLGNAWSKFTSSLSDGSGPLTAVTNLIAGLLDKVTNLLNYLSSYKMPAWLEKMFAGGLNGMVADALKPANKGGASGSWDAPKGPQYGQTTKYKTDKAGITGSKGNAGQSEEKRATALAKLNLQLDNQLKVMQMIGPEAEKYEMFSRIEEGLIGKKIKLNADETKSLKDKIAAIVEGRAVQQEMNRIYEESVEPLRTYNSSLQASQKLLDEGKISITDFGKEQIKAFEKYTDAIDPLKAFNKSMQEQFSLLQLFPKEREVENQLMNLRNDLLQKGIVLTEEEERVKRRQLKTLQEGILAQQTEDSLLADSVGKREEFIRQLTAINKLKSDPKSGFTAGDAAKSVNDQLQTAGFDTTYLQAGADAQVAVYQGMYDKIKQLRDANLINAQDAAMLEAQVKVKQLDQQTMFAQSYFTGIAQLSTSSNKKLAAIGKAAAISNAIIDTYKAATGAYASLASIPIVGPALGAAAAAAAIGAGMANVQAIRSQGFKEGGYTGDMPTSAAAGTVHGQEYVFDAASTARLGVDNLEALRRNSTMPTAKGNSAPVVNNSVPVTVANFVDSQLFADFINSAQGEQLIINTVRNNPDSIRAGQNV